MPRPPLGRFVECVPRVTYFKPAGVPMRDLDEVCLTVDEIEALRLKDVEGLEQEEGALRMGVARTTFRRILVTARAKVARALTEGKAIRIEGGNYRVEPLRRFKCEDCGFTWEVPFGTGQKGVDMSCPECKTGRIHRIDREGHGFGNRPWGWRGGHARE